MISRKLLFFPPVILGVLLLVYMVSQKKAPVQNPPSETVRHVRIIQTAENDFVPRVTGYGNVEPARVWNAVSQVGGRVEYVHPEFKKGALLKEGTEIVRISDKDYRIAIKQAEANIRSSEARLKELEVTEQNNKAALKIEEQALEIKKQELLRKQNLLKKGTTSQATVDLEQRDLLNQQKRVLDLNNSIKLLPTQKEVQKEQLEIYKTQLETAKLNLERTSIKLPFTGRISEAKVEVTQYVGTGTNLGSADGVDIAEIPAQISVKNLTRMLDPFSKNQPPFRLEPTTFRTISKAIGLHAIIRLNSGFRVAEWKGEISRGSDTLDPKTRSAGLIIAVKDNYKKIIPGKRPPLVKGMFVEVELRANPLKNQIAVPRSAIHNNTLYIANKENRLELRPVEISLIQGNLAVISKGLKAGEKVVVSDISPAIPGMLLKLTDDTELADKIKKEALAEGDVE